MKTHVHEAVNGLRIEYPEPEPKVARFLALVERAAADPKVSHGQLIGLVYGRDNPLLTPSPLGTLTVTQEVLAHSIYPVLSDLINRKQMAEMRVAPEKLSVGYTLTVNEAAERLGITPSAVRQAIAKRRLACWVKDGTYYLHPKWTDQYARARAEGFITAENEVASPKPRSSAASRAAK